ncbi:MAG: transcriptional regulator [Terracidiphilus sp.]
MNRLQFTPDFSARIVRIVRLLLFFFCFLWPPGLAAQKLWNATGPAGGDARAFAAVPGEPQHLYMGSTNSWLYESLDGGADWKRLAKLDTFDDLILDHIIVDPVNSSTIFVAAWRLDHADGGLWVSHNAGKDWSEMVGLHGQSIRAFAQSPSNPEMLFAGTLDGVYRSSDSGATWTLISPPGSQEIHEVESLAIDPLDPEVIYAGTWHLPWKTIDGGKSWQSIKAGIIDDSDVFSIIIDPASPRTVFASACSGIYKSLDAGGLFSAIKGIPSSARRTRVLKKDPLQFNVVYAGTTEGLFKSVDGGTSFQRMTGPEVIVNDIFIDPRNSDRVLLATDRGGVLFSQDAGATFTLSNDGFSARKVEALLVDSGAPQRIFAGVVNDKSYGGAFVSSDGGARWEQISAGLEGRDLFALAESPDGTILAGTNHGIFALGAGDAGLFWSPRNTIQNVPFKAASDAPPLVAPLSVVKSLRSAKATKGEKLPEEKPVETSLQISSRVYALDISGDAWLASTATGLFTSKDQGASWQGGPVMGSVDFRSVAAHGAMLAAAQQQEVAFSTDAGLSWKLIGIPAVLTSIHCVAFSADGTIWLGAREGVYFSPDLGQTWMWVHRFPLNDVDELYFDAHLGKVLVSSRGSDQIYVIDPKTLDWKWAQTGYRIARVREAGERLLAASLYDGVLIEPPEDGVQAAPQ